MIGMNSMANILSAGCRAAGLGLVVGAFTIAATGCDNGSAPAGGSAVVASLEEGAQLDGVVAEAACGQCQFGMEGDGCQLAVRIRNKMFFVDGTSIDEHGDAHAADGFCNSVRHARISGQIVDGRVASTAFELLAAKTP
jgi:hypothetical protein